MTKGERFQAPSRVPGSSPGVTDQGRRWRRALAGVGLAAATVASMTTGVGAAAEVLDPVELFEFSETAPSSPLSPGIVSQRHYTRGFREPVLAPDGFAELETTDTSYVITEVSLGGVVSTSVIDDEAISEDFVRLLQLTDGAMLAETIVYSGLSLVGSAPFRVDRETGDVLTAPGSADTTGSSRMSPDGGILVSSSGEVPYWISVVDGAFGVDGNAFTESLFVPDALVPTLSPDGRIAALAGNVNTGGEIFGLLLVDDTSGVWEAQQIALSCPVDECDFEVDAISSRGDEASIYLTGYSLDGGDRSAANHYVAHLPGGEVEASMPVSVTSPNGRYIAGMRASGDDFALDLTEFVVRDLASGRERTFDSTLPEAYRTNLLSLSDDGRTIRYTAQVPCFNICLIRPAYFGSIELAQVAEVTRGPAEDQLLRLYRAVFGRIPDIGGFEFWMDRYRNGEPLVDIAAAFAAADEFVTRYGADPTDEQLIDGLYRNTLGRAGDDGGFEFWLGRRAGGMTIPELLVAFADSPENLDRTGTRGTWSVAEGRVSRLYRAMLGRAPDDGGLVFWTGQYHAGVSLEEMARRFAGQPEYEALYGAAPTNAELVDAVYRNVLGRAGDDGGVAFWNQRMANGLSVAGLFVEFANSEENILGTGTVR